MALVLVVPAAGLGTRLHSVTGNRPKVMVSLCGQPLLRYVLQTGMKLPVQRIVILVAPDGSAIQQYFGTNFGGIPISYVSQIEPRGLADAVALAEPYVENVMLVLNGDELYVNTRHEFLLHFLESAQADGVVGYVRTTDLPRISTGYALCLDANSVVSKLVEKPPEPWNDLLGVGTWLLGKGYFSCFRNTPLDKVRGERDFVAVVQRMSDGGDVIRGMDLGGEFVNVNSPEDIAKAELLLRVRSFTDAQLPFCHREQSISLRGDAPLITEA
jgi:UDP-N-acetylglucosamine diphosphorylase / glucose-1-phosphate thymidylyltransferase / UDP-N-acetylgalactosamine diphosphorylase / glucosamine-1-phosphate N-acetyltransferase / galactosamine-1-phosphate N-acetyltransferase